jgi:hypothetical protein
MPFYWKRGIVAGLAVGLIMSFLVRRIDPAVTSGPQVRTVPASSIGEGNVAVRPPTPDNDEDTSRQHRTPFGPLMGVIVLALFWSMPGPDGPRGGLRATA